MKGLSLKAPLFPTFPDVDNLLKFLCDAMTGVVYHDDSQIVSITCEKKYIDYDEDKAIGKTELEIKSIALE